MLIQPIFRQGDAVRKSRSFMTFMIIKHWPKEMRFGKVSIFRTTKGSKVWQHDAGGQSSKLVDAIRRGGEAKSFLKMSGLVSLRSYRRNRKYNIWVVARSIDPLVQGSCTSWEGKDISLWFLKTSWADLKKEISDFYPSNPTHSLP
jgi:hypothetical protein